MDAALIIALIALAGSILGAGLTAFGPPWVQPRREATKNLTSYREPLLAAVYELQARLHNILTNQFLERYLVSEDSDKQDAALETTLYVFAQFFGWKEIIRRDVQLLRFSSNRKTRAIQSQLRNVTELFLTERFGSEFMMWRVEQRGLGEKMIQASDGRLGCLGYASFIDQRSELSRWLAPIERDLRTLSANGRARLTEIQHQLLDLVNTLDRKHVRYPFSMKRA